MTILFSPIGTADPLTQLGDGPMLHIVRHRSPSTVVLFLSPAMAEHQRVDARYTKAIELLSESLGRPAPEIRLVESSFGEVHRFDHYIEEFEQVLAELSKETSGQPVLANVSSGTPGMEQALVALGAFGRLNLELLQVATPKRDVNSRQDREDPHNYDLAALWEWNEELQDRAEVRIESVGLPNFSDRLLRENVVELVGRYEYEAAYELIGQMRSVDAKAAEMVRAAADRLNLDGQLPARAFGGTPLAFKPNDLLSEHIYVMEVRLRQGHWAEFLRALTPALTEIMKAALRPYLPERKYLIAEGGVFTDRYDWEKIAEDPRLSAVLRRCHREMSTFVTNDALMQMMREYCDDDVLVGRVDNLRRMESRCRNPLAHQIRSSARKRLEKEGGVSLDDVMGLLFDLRSDLQPGLYDRINETIVALI